MRGHAQGTRLRALGSNAKTSFGLVGVPLVIFDEPSSQNVNNGELLWDSVRTALGKHNSRLRVVLIGTQAPSERGWWIDLLDRGSTDDTYVQKIVGDRGKWNQWREVLRCNPVTRISNLFKRRLRVELEEARRDDRLKAAFMSYRLNMPGGDETTMLINLADWKRMLEREVPEREGAPVVGIDLGAGRAWSAAAALWQTGRVEALACAPGIPDISEQERRDRVPAGLYQKLVDQGTLTVAEGLRVQPPSELWQSVLENWGLPHVVVCDRFRLSELEDAVNGACRVEPRRTRWSESSEDIRYLRKIVLDGNVNVDKKSQDLVAASLAGAMVVTDDAGNCRLKKRGSNNESRDDVAAALVICAGEWFRLYGVGPRKFEFIHVGFDELVPGAVF